MNFRVIDLKLKRFLKTTPGRIVVHPDSNVWFNEKKQQKHVKRHDFVSQLVTTTEHLSCRAGLGKSMLQWSERREMLGRFLNTHCWKHTLSVPLSEHGQTIRSSWQCFVTFLEGDLWPLKSLVGPLNRGCKGHSLNHLVSGFRNSRGGGFSKLHTFFPSNNLVVFFPVYLPHVFW